MIKSVESVWERTTKPRIVVETVLAATGLLLNVLGLAIPLAVEATIFTVNRFILGKPANPFNGSKD